MIVAGSMIGSGIFIVAGEMAREVGSAGWMLLAWVIAGNTFIFAKLFRRSGGFCMGGRCFS
jgi:APA family basic amino acid/polyamine antiporter